MADVLGNRPLSVDLPVREFVIHADDEHIQARQNAAKAFDEVGEHPRWVTKGELSFGPRRTFEL